MTDLQKATYRVTLVKILAYTGGVISICYTIHKSVTPIETMLQMHEYRLNKVENDVRDIRTFVYRNQK